MFQEPIFSFCVWRPFIWTENSGKNMYYNTNKNKVDVLLHVSKKIYVRSVTTPNPFLFYVYDNKYVFNIKRIDFFSSYKIKMESIQCD